MESSSKANKRANAVSAGVNPDVRTAPVRADIDRAGPRRTDLDRTDLDRTDLDRTAETSATLFRAGERVAVIAANSADQQLIEMLLNKAGYQVGVFASADLISTTDDVPNALVVCHRQNQTSPGMPNCQGGQRVVVMSDCDSEQTIVQALETGAHHYFNINESPDVLLARLEAALRQHSVQVKKVLDVYPFKFNLERRNVYRDEKLISLSPKEYEFAYYLFANRHRVVVNAELMTSVWSLPSSMDARRIDTAACRVRKKMQLDDTSQGWCLRRIRRVGYELLWRGEDAQASTMAETASVSEGRAAAMLKPSSTLVIDKAPTRPSQPPSSPDFPGRVRKMA